MSERGRDWNAVLESLLQQATIQSCYRETNRDNSTYSPKSIRSIPSTASYTECGMQDQRKRWELQDSHQVYRFEDGSASESSTDSDYDSFEYSGSELEDHAFLSRGVTRSTSPSTVSTDAEETTTCVQSPPTRPCNPLNPPEYHALGYYTAPFHRPAYLSNYKSRTQPSEKVHYSPPPPPPPPPPPFTASATATTTPFPTSQPFSKPSMREQRDHVVQHDVATTQLQITIDWVGRGILQFLDCQRLSRTDIVGRALELARSGQFQFENSKGYRKPTVPASLHATLRGVRMGEDYLHITSRVENFHAIYASATRNEKGIIPVFEVEVRSSEDWE